MFQVVDVFATKVVAIDRRQRHGGEAHASREDISLHPFQRRRSKHLKTFGVSISTEISPQAMRLVTWYLRVDVAEKQSKDDPRIERRMSKTSGLGTRTTHGTHTTRGWGRPRTNLILTSLLLKMRYTFGVHRVCIR